MGLNSKILIFVNGIKSIDCRVTKKCAKIKLINENIYLLKFLCEKILLEEKLVLPLSQDISKSINQIIHLTTKNNGTHKHIYRNDCGCIRRIISMFLHRQRR